MKGLRLKRIARVYGNSRCKREIQLNGVVGSRFCNSKHKNMVQV